jgi:hypothetical protein
MTGAPAADADCASISQKPEATIAAESDGKRPSTPMVPGTAVNQVGGSMIAVSLPGAAPVIGLADPPLLSQLTIALRPFPERVAALKPVTSDPAVRKFAPLAPAPI